MDYPEEVNEATPYGSEGLSLLLKEVVILSEIWRNYRSGIMRRTIKRRGGKYVYILGKFKCHGLQIIYFVLFKYDTYIYTLERRNKNSSPE